MYIWKEIKITLRTTTSCYCLYEVNYWFLILGVITGILFNNLMQKVQELSICGACTTTSLLDSFCTTSFLRSSAFMLNRGVPGCEKKSTVIFVIILAWRIDGKQAAFLSKLILHVIGMNSQLITRNVKKIPT